MKLILIAGSLLIVPAATLAAGSKALRAGQDKPGAAGQLTLDLDTLPPDSAPSVPAEQTPISSSPTDEPRTAPGPAPLFDLDTPIGRLVGDPRSRAVLDRNLPGVSTDENLPKFRALSLRRFQPLTGGQLTDELLARTAADLAAIRPMAPGKGRNASR